MVDGTGMCGACRITVGGKTKFVCVDAVSDNKVNRFNGTGVGIYATSNGKQSINKASYQWFEYKEEN